jgi:hypothetical protein
MEAYFNANNITIPPDPYTHVKDAKLAEAYQSNTPLFNIRITNHDLLKYICTNLDPQLDEFATMKNIVLYAKQQEINKYLASIPPAP